jgi:hypothetical protein
MNRNINIEFVYVSISPISRDIWQLSNIIYQFHHDLVHWPWKCLSRWNPYDNTHKELDSMILYIYQKTRYFRLPNSRYHFQQDPLIWHKKGALHFKFTWGQDLFQNCTPYRSNVMKSVTYTHTHTHPLRLGTWKPESICFPDENHNNLQHWLLAMVIGRSSSSSIHNPLG